MYKFKSISLKNWKNFREAHVDFTDRMFVVGANAAGKSNLLDAFRFLKDLTSNGLIKAVNSRGGLSKIRNLNARQPSYVEIVVKLVNSDDNDDIWEYQLRFNTADGNKSDVNISVERVVHNNMEIKHRRYKDPEEDYSTRQFTHLEQPAANKDFRVLFDTFQNISYVNIIPQLVRDTGVVVPSVAKDDYYGSSLLTRVSETAKRTRDSRLKKISAVLRLAVPQFSGLEYVQDSDGTPHLQVKYEHFRPQGARQKEDQFSDGTIRLIGFLWAILDGDGLILLEEPDNYLHAEIVRQLPMFISNAQRSSKGIQRQVIIASHSFDLLNTNTISGSEIIVLENSKEGTVVKNAMEIDIITEKLRAGFSPADATIPHVAPRELGEQLSVFDIM